MKKKFMLFTLASGIILSAFSLKSFSANAAETTPATESADVAIDAENFPDEYLRKDIQSFDLNRDGVLDEAEIAKATMISIPNKTSTVKGLEYFTALEDLSVCLNDNLSALDLSDFVSAEIISFKSSQPGFHQSERLLFPAKVRALSYGRTVLR